MSLDDLARRWKLWLGLGTSLVAAIFGVFTYFARFARADAVNDIKEELDEKIGREDKEIRLHAIELGATNARLNANDHRSDRIEEDIHWGNEALFRLSQRLRAGVEEPPHLRRPK